MSDRPPDAARLRALGHELVRIHDRLRADLAALLADVEAAHDGRSQGPAADAMDAIGAGAAAGADDVRAQLYERCLSICAAVHAHHANEAERGFPLLEERFPGLAPALERFRAEHRVLADLRRRLQETLGRLGTHAADGGAGAAEAIDEVHAELHRLAAELEAHFDREERQLVPALNAL